MWRELYIEWYLLSKTVSRGEEPVSLTVDGRISTSTDRIHFPVSVVVVYYVEVTMPAPEITTKHSILISIYLSEKIKYTPKMKNLGILCIRPSPKWLYAMVTCIILSLVYESVCPNKITCIIIISCQLFNVWPKKKTKTFYFCTIRIIHG